MSILAEPAFGRATGRGAEHMGAFNASIQRIASAAAHSPSETSLPLHEVQQEEQETVSLLRAACSEIKKILEIL